MGRNIVVCFDGTWNSADDRDTTNVSRLHESLSQDAGQVVHYLPGVGTDVMTRIRGGLFGHGLFGRIKQGYRHVVEAYEPGDRLFLFGFSRGAYSARSLAGMIARCGVLRREACPEVRALALPQGALFGTDDDEDPNSVPDEFDKTFGLYKMAYDPANRPFVADFKQRHAHDAPVELVGVWDTVGSLGMPDTLAVGIVRSIVNWSNRARYGFLDTELSSAVRAGYHAVAVDEARKAFAPTLWTEPADMAQDKRRLNVPGSNVEQVWFCGAHSDVGGGYPETALSDITLNWMASRAAQHGLRFRHQLPSWQPDPTGLLHDSAAEALFGAGRFLKWLAAKARSIQRQSLVHATVDHRISRVRTYQPPNLIITRDREPRCLDTDAYGICM